MAAGKQKRKRVSARVVEDEDYQLSYERVAGIDVAKASAVVCVRLPPEPGRDRRTSRIWEVTASVPEIGALAVELRSAGVQLVSMESTSDYWRVWFVVLEAAGLRVQLVNSAQAKNLPGRPKTGELDARWIARLTEMGLLRGSFVPPPQIRALRAYTRQLVHLTQDRTRYWQRLEKLLEDALCKLTAVVSGLAGSVSCREMIEAMIAGERDPQVLASCARGPMRGKRAALVQAFTGMAFGPQHAFTARSHLSMIDHLDAGIAALQARVRDHVAQIPAAWGVDADGSTGPDAGLGDDAAVLPAVARLAEIPGVSPGIAIGLIAGTGLDMRQFPTPAHLVSRAGMVPVANQSGPRKGRGKKGQGNSYARRLATQAGNGAAGTDTFPGERHRRGPAAARRRRVEESQLRRRPVHPGHRLAPAQRSRRPVHRPGPGPLRQARRHQPQGPRPQTAARSPRLGRHPHPPRGRLRPSARR
jgi:transposase